MRALQLLALLLLVRPQRRKPGLEAPLLPALGLGQV
jgi:hypothetical protein